MKKKKYLKDKNVLKINYVLYLLSITFFYDYLLTIFYLKIKVIGRRNI